MSVLHPSKSLQSKCEGHTNLSESISIIALKTQDESSVLHRGFAVASLNGKIEHSNISTLVEDQSMNMKQAFGFRVRSEVIIDILTACVVDMNPRGRIKLCY